MSKIQTWALGGLAAVALGVGALLVSGAVTSAQTSTPVPSTAPSGTSPTPDGQHNCPNMGNNSGGTMHYGPAGTNGSTTFHGSHHSHGGSTVSNTSGA